jgi:hypothetical protein
VLQKVAEDLVLQRLPDLGDFPDQVIEEQLSPLFTKSGLTTDGILLLQELVRRTSYGLITMHTARPSCLEGEDHGINLSVEPTVPCVRPTRVDH